MEWVKKNILKQTDEDIEEINKQISEEQQAMAPAVDENGNPVQDQQQQLQQPQPQQSQAQLAAAGGNPPQQSMVDNSGKNLGETTEEMPSKFELRANELEFLR